MTDQEMGARISVLLEHATIEASRYEPGDEAREYWIGQVDVLTMLLQEPGN